MYRGEYQLDYSVNRTTLFGPTRAGPMWTGSLFRIKLTRAPITVIFECGTTRIISPKLLPYTSEADAYS